MHLKGRRKAVSLTAISMLAPVVLRGEFVTLPCGCYAENCRLGFGGTTGLDGESPPTSSASHPDLRSGARMTNVLRRHADATARLIGIINTRRHLIRTVMSATPSSDVALQSVRRVAELAEAVSGHTAELVAIARNSGATWNQIGDALGVTKQAAHERFRHHHLEPAPTPMAVDQVRQALG